MLIYKPTVEVNDEWDLPASQSFEITSTVRKLSSRSAYVYYTLITDFTTYNMGSLREKGCITMRNNSSTILMADNDSYIISLNTDVELKYSYNNGQHTLSANGYTITANELCNFNKLKIHTIQNYSMKNLKVRKL